MKQYRTSMNIQSLERVTAGTNSYIAALENEIDAQQTAFKEVPEETEKGQRLVCFLFS